MTSCAGILLTLIVGCLCLMVGILIGVADCKRTFGIPHGAMGVDEDGNYTFS